MYVINRHWNSCLFSLHTAQEIPALHSLSTQHSVTIVTSLVLHFLKKKLLLVFVSRQCYCSWNWLDWLVVFPLFYLLVCRYFYFVVGLVDFFHIFYWLWIVVLLLFFNWGGGGGVLCCLGLPFTACLFSVVLAEFFFMSIWFSIKVSTSWFGGGGRLIDFEGLLSLIRL